MGSPATGYVVASDGAPAGSRLFRIDVATAALTPVGTITNAPFVIDIAFDSTVRAPASRGRLHRAAQAAEPQGLAVDTAGNGVYSRTRWRWSPRRGATRVRRGVVSGCGGGNYCPAAASAASRWASSSP